VLPGGPEEGALRGTSRLRWDVRTGLHRLPRLEERLAGRGGGGGPSEE